MNKVQLVGRLVKDPESKNTASQVLFCNFTVAVQRRYKNEQGKFDSDFINCLAWRNTAQFIGSYFRKGMRIGLTGSIQTRSYEDNNGQKHFITEVLVDEAEFVENPNNNTPANKPQPPVKEQAKPQMNNSSQNVVAPSMDESDGFDDDLSGYDSLPFEF